MPLTERVARLEWHHDHQQREADELKSELFEVAKELRGVADSVRSLVERRKISDRVVVSVLTAGVLGVAALLLKMFQQIP